MKVRILSKSYFISAVTPLGVEGIICECFQIALILPSRQWRGPGLKGSDFALQLVYLFETLIFFQLFGFVFDCFS